jgi:hypothetical protein
LAGSRFFPPDKGGVFGFGGEQVSGSEVATINEIGEAINI